MLYCIYEFQYNDNTKGGFKTQECMWITDEMTDKLANYSLKNTCISKPLCEDIILGLLFWGLMPL